MLQAIVYSKSEGLKILDQLQLPLKSEYVTVSNVDDGFKAIKTMQVRGAPAIAIVGMLSMAEELKTLTFTNTDEMVRRVNQRLSYLVTSRPTAVNLSKAAEEMKSLAFDHRLLSVAELREKLSDFASSMRAKDIADNQAIGKHGAEAIRANLKKEGKAILLTHCNTGSLATAGFGTALGVVRAVAEAGVLEHVFCTETRPYNQGARLTAYELVHDKLPATLICDSMVALLMERNNVSAVVVGADRVAGNGDTANKIGTHQLAIIAKRFGVQFYVCAPFTSIDLSLKCGKEIKIEERPEKELACLNGRRIAAPGIKCWNPAFDVTPAELITGIVTEKGVFPPDSLKLQ